MIKAKKDYETVKGFNRSSYLVQKGPDFSTVIWGNGELERIEDGTKVLSGRKVFDCLVGLLTLSGIKTDARIEFGNLKSQECRIDCQRARLATLSGEVSLEFLDRKKVYIVYISFLLPRNPSDVSRMPLKAQNLSNEIHRYVDNFSHNNGLECHYHPCVGIRANAEKDIAAEILGVERYNVIGEFTRLDQYAILLGKVDRMLLRAFGRDITQKKL